MYFTPHQNENDCDSTHTHSTLCLKLFPKQSESTFPRISHGILQARILEWVAISFSRDLPDPGIEPRSPTLKADASTSEPTREAFRISHTPLEVE